MTAHERSGWRDEALSLRHRTWGSNCPGADIDFLLVEYDRSVPVALIEYKHHLVGSINPEHPNYRAVGQLADFAQLPFFVVFYWPDCWAFRVQSMNLAAEDIEAYKDADLLTEREYVSGLYELRDREPDLSVIQRLNNTHPWEEVAA